MTFWLYMSSKITHASTQNHASSYKRSVAADARSCTYCGSFWTAFSDENRTGM